MIDSPFKYGFFWTHKMSETIEIQYPYWVFTFLLNFEIFYNFFFKKWRNSQNSIRQRMRSKWINVKKRCLRRTVVTNFNKKVKKINKKKAFGDDSYPHTRLCVFFRNFAEKVLFRAISRGRESPEMLLFSWKSMIFSNFDKLSLMSNVLVLSKS